MPSSGEMSKESNLVVISKGITTLPEVKYFKAYSWSSSELFLNFLSSFGSLKINFLHSFFTGFLSSSVIVFARRTKRCLKYLIVSINVTWFPMFEKFILVNFLPPIEISLIPQAPTLIPFKKTKKSKRSKLWAKIIILYRFSLTLKLH